MKFHAFSNLMAYQKHTHTNPQATYMKAIYIYMYVCIWLRELFKKQHSHFKKYVI